MRKTSVYIRELETGLELYTNDNALGYGFRPGGNSIYVMTGPMSSEFIYLKPGYIVSVEETGDDS